MARSDLYVGRPLAIRRPDRCVSLAEAGGQRHRASVAPGSPGGVCVAVGQCSGM